ncbi:hypothetical protein IEQ34_013715 [Dendrobium chrysotoxum]|uniref:Uncharacterized protein n=1 Tax=Dendrobium chrysotoxum TaxID=161865 RepID=A0AAV7G9L9_DENCH|nr:hypothetical protein IEQ34_013715 [Dendrobium chrysotoxum]
MENWNIIVLWELFFRDCFLSLCLFSYEKGRPRMKNSNKNFVVECCDAPTLSSRVLGEFIGCSGASALGIVALGLKLHFFIKKYLNLFYQTIALAIPPHFILARTKERGEKRGEGRSERDERQSSLHSFQNLILGCYKSTVDVLDLTYVKKGRGRFKKTWLENIRNILSLLDLNENLTLIS